MTRAGAIAVGLVACAACGDNRADGRVLDAVSGSRLSVFWYGYDDGARQADTFSSFTLYDRAEHANCTYRDTADGATRCVPTAEPVVFRDAACTDAVGRVDGTAKPTHFVAGDGVVERLYHAGFVTTTPQQYYELSGGSCDGPFSGGAGTYFSVGGEVDLTSLVALDYHPDHEGDGPIGMGMMIGSDGLRVPSGAIDHERDQSCHPRRRADGSVVCAPSYVTEFFRDPACTRAVVPVYRTNSVPPAVQSIDPSDGCAVDLEVGGEVNGVVYQVSDGTCVATSLGSNYRVFAADTPIEAPVLTQTIESEPRRRLQRIVLGSGDLRYYDTLLYDTAIGGLCSAHSFGADGKVYCTPTVTADALSLYNPGCQTHVYAAEVAVAACQPPAFATSRGTSTDVRAIGAPAGAVYRLDVDTQECVPYVPAPGRVLYRLGPPIDPKAFEHGLHYGER